MLSLADLQGQVLAKGVVIAADGCASTECLTANKLNEAPHSITPGFGSHTHNVLRPEIQAQLNKDSSASARHFPEFLIPSS